MEPSDLGGQPSPPGDVNPYDPPWLGSPTGVPGQPAPLNPQARVFNTQLITAATFFASALAGTILLYVSLSRLGRSAEARRALLLGGGLTLTQVLGALILPYGIGLIVPFGAMLAMNTLSKRLQDPFVIPHLSQGAARGSGWFVAGTCLASFACMLVLLGGGTLLKQAASRHVEVSPGHVVTYNKRAGEIEARKVGAILESRGVFVPGQRASVDYSRYGENVTLKVVLRGDWQSVPVMNLYTEVADEIFAQTGHRFVTVLLLDRMGKQRQKVSISR